MRFVTGGILLVLSGLAQLGWAAEDLSPEQRKFFESQVRPLLAEHCWKCHGEKEQKGNLRLDSLGTILGGGDSGAALVRGKPDESLLMEAVRYESYEMPPDGQLDERQIHVLETWIQMGAPWPGDDGTIVKRAPQDRFSEEDRQWWAFQPVKVPEIPDIPNSDWARNEIDYFIAARQQAQGLAPAPEADRRSLIRRLYFDLVGLPPSPDEIAEFVADDDPYAYEKLVDRLLDSPEYGERWARHWLDLVRYADSDGYRADHYRPNAWLYRDYVIESLNSDKPYDRFVQEQIAGDELFPNDPSALIATGYLRHGIYEYNSRDVPGQWDLILNEITDTTSDVFLGLGLQCARCHDHKFDPLLQKDYFGLRAFFEAVSLRDDLVAALPQTVSQHELAMEDYRDATEKLQSRIDELLDPLNTSGRKTAVGRFPDDIQEMIRKPREERTPQEQLFVELAWRQVLYEYERADSRLRGDDKEEYLALKRELAKFDELKPEPLPHPLAATDVGPEAPPTVIPKKGTIVAPHFPTILQAEPAEIVRPQGADDSTGRRTTLALWMTDPSNPLTTRVIVNRVWQYHFGRGLAANSSDFGRLGDPPTHPQLLDWLTARFLQEDWRLKSLHRLIVNSATYRQSTTHPRFEEFQVKDPGNVLYWRGETRRLDAEQIRDSILAVTGQLDSKRGGPGGMPDETRRSIYTRYMRNSRDPLLDAFDLPQFFSSTSSRDTTTSPVQSLLMINSQAMLHHAAVLSRRVDERLSAEKSPTARVRELWKLVLGRPATDAETTAALAFLKQQADRIGREQSHGPSKDVATAKMPYRDGQSVLFDPESEMGRFAVPHQEQLNVDDFTVEAFIQLRSIYDSGAVRTVVSKWSGSGQQPGWAFGVTGKGSRRKPQTLVIQLFGRRSDASAEGIVEAAIFSDQHIDINKPYFVAASVRLADDKSAGSVTFYLKDLSNDEEPLQVAEVPLDIRGGINNDDPLTFGARGKSGSQFDGLIDDVRLSRGSLSEEQLLLGDEGFAKNTIGYWQFEPSPGMFQNSASNGLNVMAVTGDERVAAPEEQAFIDLCHVLMNSNDFLYVD